MASAPTRTFNPNAENFYTRLGVHDDASSDKIRKAYKQAALQYHPDKNSSSEATKAAAEEAFKSIGEAYATLSDANERAAYDRDHTFQAQQPSTYQSHSTHDYSDPPKAKAEANACEAFFKSYESVHEGRGFRFDKSPDLAFFDSSKASFDANPISRLFASFVGKKYMVYLGKEIGYISAKNLGLAKFDEEPKKLKEEGFDLSETGINTDLSHEELKKNNKVVYIESDVIFSYLGGYGERTQDRSYKTPVHIEVVMDARSYKTLENLSREGKITIEPTTDGNVLARKK